MARCVCCPVLSGCSTGCYVPASLQLSLSIGAFDFGDFTPTPTEEALIASVVDGTYVLEWYSGPTVSRHFYQLSFTSGDWDVSLDLGWRCTDSSTLSSPTMYAVAQFCNNTSPYLTFNLYNSSGISLARANFPGSTPANIIDYCSGTTSLLYTSAYMDYRKIQCNSTSLCENASFFVDVVVEA